LPVSAPKAWVPSSSEPINANRAKLMFLIMQYDFTLAAFRDERNIPRKDGR
jgi:hypothetical protein